MQGGIAMKPQHAIAGVLIALLLVSTMVLAMPVPKIKDDIDRIDFIHYKNPARASAPKQTACYKLMGVTWKTTPVDYVINPTNPQGLSESFVTSTIATSAETWDAATATELFENVYSVNASEHYGTQDFVNVLDFGDLDSSVIGITSVWFTRRGREIVEFDMRLNTDYTWGDATLDSTAMDLQNIATHEFGHTIGLSDIYSTACGSVTMYGYSSNGETSKRTLETPDVTGLQKMYG